MIRRLTTCVVVSIAALGASALCLWLSAPVPNDSLGHSALFGLAWLFSLVPLAAAVMFFDRTLVLVIVIGVAWVWGLIWILVWLFAGFQGPSV